jgi:hypothetical protein
MNQVLEKLSAFILQHLFAAFEELFMQDFDILFLSQLPSCCNLLPTLTHFRLLKLF